MLTLLVMAGLAPPHWTARRGHVSVRSLTLSTGAAHSRRFAMQPDLQQPEFGALLAAPVAIAPPVPA